jgi:hypothetical protein
MKFKETEMVLHLKRKSLGEPFKGGGLWIGRLFGITFLSGLSSQNKIVEWHMSDL